MRPPEDPSPDPASPDPPVRARDLEKIREKQPIYLEPRQVLRIVLLSIGGLAAAFGAGWWARGTPPPAPREEDPPACEYPSALPVPREVPEDHDGARVARSQVLPMPSEVEPRDGEPLAVSWTRRPPDETPPPPPPPVPPTAPAAEERSPLPQVPPTTPPSGTATGPRIPGQAVPEPPIARKDDSAPPAPSPSVEDSGKAAADRPDALAPQDPATGARIPLAQRRWSVQVRAYRDPQLAEEYAATLKKRGYSARVLAGRDPAGTAWYRIHVGRFATSAEAQRFAARFNAREGEKSIAVEGP